MCMRVQYAGIQRVRYLVRGQGEGDQVHGCLLEFAQTAEALQRLQDSKTPNLRTREGMDTVVEHMQSGINDNSWIGSPRSHA